MADKTARVRVDADPKGFIAGMKAAEKAGEAAGAKIESKLSAAANKAASNFEKAARVIAKIGQSGERDASGKFLGGGAGLEKIKAMAKEVSEAYKEAYKNALKLATVKTDNAATLRSESNKELMGKAGTVLAGAAAGAIGLTIKATMDANAVADKANRLSIGARGAGQEYVDPKALTAEFFAIAKDVKGITAEAAADGAAKFVQMTGDLKTARSSLADFATAANASGASVQDVAGTAAAISQQFGITDPAQIKDVLAALIYQGKAGAFELQDAASLFPRLAAAGASFGLDKGAQGVKTLGGFAQLVRGGTGSGEEAATAAVAVLSAFKAQATTLDNNDVHVYDKKGKTRDLPTLLAESIAKLGGNDVKKKNELLGTVFGREGAKAINPLAGQYQDLYAAAKGTEAQRQAQAMEELRLKILESVNAAGTWTDVQRDSAQASSTASATMTASYEELKAGMAEQMLPQFAKFAEAMGKAGPAISVFVSVMTKAAEALGFIGQKSMDAGEGAAKWYHNDDDKLLNTATSEREKEAAARSALKDMQMSPQAMALADPEKLNEMRAKAQSLQNQAEMHGSLATAAYETYRTTDRGKEMRDASASASGNGKVNVDNEVRVRIMNPKEVGGAAGGAPPGNSGAPVNGWYPR